MDHLEALSDALRSSNVRAFLRAIRLGEGTADDAGYRRLFGGGNFDSFADHPRVRTYEKRDGQFIRNGKIDFTTAAGAYQITATTWDEVRARYGLRDFSPNSQDLAAVGLLIRRRALDDVLAGRIEQVIEKCRLEWASLPGSPYGQRTESLRRVLDAYAAAGGTFAPVPAQATTEVAAEQPPAPIAESKPTFVREAEMPLPLAGQVALTLAPELLKLLPWYSSGSPSAERNIKALEAVAPVLIETAKMARRSRWCSRIRVPGRTSSGR